MCGWCIIGVEQGGVFLLPSAPIMICDAFFVGEVTFLYFFDFVANKMYEKK